MELDYYGRSPIHIPSYTGNIEKIKSHLAAGWDINGKVKKMGNHTPLFFACYGLASIEAVKFLLDQGADINATDVKGRGVIHQAANAANPEIIACLLGLLEAEAINKLDLDGRNILHAICMSSSEDKTEEDMTKSIEIIFQSIEPSMLQEFINKKDNFGYTPAALAKLYGYNFVQPLLSKYAKLESTQEISPQIDMPDFYGRSKLHIAAWNNDTTAVKELLEQGADAGLENPLMGGRTPFLYSAENCSKQPSVANLFLEKCKPEVIAKSDSFGGNFLHFAAKAGQFEFIADTYWSNKEQVALLSPQLQALAACMFAVDDSNISPWHVLFMRDTDKYIKADTNDNALPTITADTLEQELPGASAAAAAFYDFWYYYRGVDSPPLDNQGRSPQDVAADYNSDSLWQAGLSCYHNRQSSFNNLLFSAASSFSKVSKEYKEIAKARLF